MPEERRTSLRVSTSHTRTVRSSLPVTSHRPSGEKAIASREVSSGPNADFFVSEATKATRSLALSGSHMRTWLSRVATNSRRQSGENASVGMPSPIASVSFAGSFVRRRPAPVAGSMNMRFGPASDETNVRPSGLIAVACTAGPVHNNSPLKRSQASSLPSQVVVNSDFPSGANKMVFTNRWPSCRRLVVCNLTFTSPVDASRTSTTPVARPTAMALPSGENESLVMRLPSSPRMPAQLPVVVSQRSTRPDEFSIASHCPWGETARVQFA